MVSWWARPILNREAWHGLEVDHVSGQDSHLAGEGDPGDSQIHRSNSDSGVSLSFKFPLCGFVEREHEEIRSVQKRSLHHRITPQNAVAVIRF